VLSSRAQVQIFKGSFSLACHPENIIKQNGAEPKADKSRSFYRTKRGRIASPPPTISNLTLGRNLGDSPEQALYYSLQMEKRAGIVLIDNVAKVCLVCSGDLYFKPIFFE